MKESEAIVKRQAHKTRFHNEDMDFMFNWAIGVTQILGMSSAQVYNAVRGIKDGDPEGWRSGFARQADYLFESAGIYAEDENHEAAGQTYLGSAYAYRAALQYCEPNTEQFNQLLQRMEDAFQTGVRYLGAPIRAVEIPFETSSLPGYYLEIPEKECPTLIMVGGGDSYREDLFYFAGYPGWQRGYNVLMVDLPGQGKVPGRGLHFRADMEKAISALLDWLESNGVEKPSMAAVYGVSGGGYFTAQGAAADPRIQAWIASTPIYDVAMVFEKSMGHVLKAPGLLLNAWMKLTSKVNRSAEINLQKYVWQFGTSDFKAAMNAVLMQAKAVDYRKILCPSLFLVGEGEDSELRRQAKFLYEEMRKGGVAVCLKEFSVADGADAHCQVNNLRLAHLVVFDWLDKVFQKTVKAGY